MTSNSQEPDRMNAGFDAAALPDPALVLTRSFDAPRDLMFRVWTDPKHVAKWWGPHGFTIPRCELDLRPGGELRIDMLAPDGMVYPMTGVFQEVVEPERLVFRSAALDDEGDPLFETMNVVTFSEEHGRTGVTVTLYVVRSTPEAAPHLGGMEIGWNQQMERLEAYVAAL